MTLPPKKSFFYIRGIQYVIRKKLKLVNFQITQKMKITETFWRRN